MFDDFERQADREAIAARIDAGLAELRAELYKAMTKHPGMHSAHEGHSVIREELEELWDHVRADTGKSADARKEAMQIAAMGLRYALDVCGAPLTAVEKAKAAALFEDAKGRAGPPTPRGGVSKLI